MVINASLTPPQVSTSGRPQLKFCIFLYTEWKQMSDTRASRIKLKYKVKDKILAYAGDSG